MVLTAAEAVEISTKCEQERRAERDRQAALNTASDEQLAAVVDEFIRIGSEKTSIFAGILIRAQNIENRLQATCGKTLFSNDQITRLYGGSAGWHIQYARDGTEIVMRPNNL